MLPTRWQVSDLACLASRAVAEDQSAECAGILAGVGWVRGSIAGPITGREDDPLTREIATAELWAAAAVQPGWAMLPYRHLCSTLRVEYHEPLEVEPWFAHGVWLVLRWLTGTGDQGAPMELPVRTCGGTVATAEQILARLVEQGGAIAHEDLASLRVEAERTSERSRRLAALVTDTARRVRS